MSQIQSERPLLNNEPTTLDVLLLSPVRDENYYIVPLLGLGYIAAAVRRTGFSVQLIDCPREKLTLASLEKRLRTLKPTIIGLQFYSSDYHTLAAMLPLIRKIHPEAVLVLGGPHPTSDPLKVLNEFPEADYAFCGEAETGFGLLVQFLLDKKPIQLTEIPGLIFRTGMSIISNPVDRNEDLDGFGFPAWDLIDPRKYGGSPQAAFFRKYPYAPISTVRGCPFNCSYCTVPNLSGRKLRKRSVTHVVDEIKLLHKEYGVREIHIIDDAFTADRKRLLEFCDLLTRAKLDVGFTFPNGVRLDTLDREVLLRMKAAGLEFFSVGVESGSDKILKDMRKGLTTAIIEEKLRLIHDAGLVVNAFFIIGYPEETAEDIQATIDFACRLPIRRAQFSLFKAYPGTEITNRLIEQGRIKAINYASFSFHKVDVTPQGISATQLKQLQRRAFIRFYMRPKVLWGTIADIRSFKHLTAILRRLFVSLFGS